MHLKLFLSILLLLPVMQLQGSWRANGLSKFVNLKCVSLDKSFSDFRYCKLKAVKRNVVALNLYVELYQLPVNNVSINLNLWKKANGYRPFLYNNTLDYCRLMKNQVQQNFVKRFINVIAKNSNMNHTCPYNHDLIVTNVIMQDKYLSRLPLPTGEYLFQFKVAAYNRWRAEVKIYILIDENVPQILK